MGLPAAGAGGFVIPSATGLLTGPAPLVGSQYHLEVGSQDYYLDLLFYHLQLRCFVVIN